jgi:two-component system, cell cycle sensor histidine kinase and response regulator CckA
LRLFEDGVTPIHLVITDQTMPGMTGDVLAQRIHQLAPHVPILIATGYSQKLLDFDLSAHGVVGFLEKPFLEAELLRAIAEALPAEPQRP